MAGPFSEQMDRAGLVAEELFAGGLDDWVFEGTADCEVRDGKLFVDAMPDRYATIWWRKDLPADALIEYRADVLAPGGDGNNVNTFIYATGPEGEDVLDVRRSGRYKEYHVIPNYLVTQTSTYSRMRRNPGFELLSERKDFYSVPGETYHVQLLKVGGLVQAAFNGRLAHEYTDSNPYTRGRLALRAWHGQNEYHWVRIWAIRP